MSATLRPTMTVSRETVLHIAKLACLELGAEEVERFERDLQRILNYVALLSEVDTANVPETTQVAVESAPLRPDSVHTSLPHSQALAESPRHSPDAFLVPAFVEEA